MRRAVNRRQRARFRVVSFLEQLAAVAIVGSVVVVFYAAIVATVLAVVVAFAHLVGLLPL